MKAKYWHVVGIAQKEQKILPSYEEKNQCACNRRQ
jgi:hypothetical protein